MRQMTRLVLDLLLGPRCLVCGTRVFPKDRQTHDAVDHPGEVPAWTR